MSSVGTRSQGLTVWEPVATVYAYDPATDTWNQRAPMQSLAAHCSVTEHEGKLYAIGGYDRKTNSAAVEVYDPQHNTWASRAVCRPLAIIWRPRPCPGKCMLSAGASMVTYRRNLLPSRKCTIPSPTAGPLAADLPTARSGITAAEFGGRVYVFGGEGGDGTFRENEAYDPARDTWQTMAPMPTGRHGLGSAVVDGRIHVISGGPTPGGSFSNLNEVFIPPESVTSKARKSRSARQVETVMVYLL